jgi:tetratricopeptide (TPR) repeat protein
MRRTLFAILAAAAFSSAGAATLYDAAARALDEGIPDVAAQKLTDWLADPALTPDQRLAGVAKLAQAQLAAGRPEAALQTVETSGVRNAATDFAKAEALGATGRWSEAYPLFAQVASGVLKTPATLGEAECLRMLDRDSEAVPLLESLVKESPAANQAKLTLAEIYAGEKEVAKAGALLADAKVTSPGEMKWKSYIEGKLLAAQGRPLSAVVLFQQVLATPEGLSENLMAGATLGISDARAATKGPELADDGIEEFIWHHSTSPYLGLMFRKLDALYTEERSPSLSELKSWIEREPPRRAALARFYLAKIRFHLREDEEAMRLVDGFIQMFPTHPLIGEALLLKGQMLLVQRKFPGALQALGAAAAHFADPCRLAEIDFSMGMAHFQQREFAPAAAAFHKAGGECEKYAEKAIFNSALSWGNLGAYDKFLKDYEEFSTRFPESPLRRELVLEEGLLQARSGDKRAPTTLSLFIRDFPDNPRVGEARIALAELAFLSTPPRPGEQSFYLKAAFETPADPQTAERAEYLAIFAADAGGKRDTGKLIDECLKFIQERPASALLPEVRMKLGQIYFRQGDFSDARNQFETLARQQPDSRFTESALFLAGQSALKSMSPDQALELFDETAKLNGPLKLYARQEQAITKTGLGSQEDSANIYDDILSAQPDAELKFAALCGKGGNYFALGATDPKYLTKAIAVFDSVAAQPDVSAYWRNRALYMKGKCLEQLHKPDEAAAVFYDVLQAQSAARGEPDYFWYYKAGFDAAHILEEQKQWKSAIGVYQKMAALKGPRAEEARGRSEQLRLEHFIWDE